MADQILYDLIVFEEWKREPKVLNVVEQCFWQHRGPLISKLWKLTQSSVSYMLKTLKTQFRFQTSFGCPPQYLIGLTNNKLEWDLALSSDGMFAAIIQDDNIEVRTASDNFSSVIGNFPIEKDGLPQWRKLAWNQQNTLLAYSNSFGDVHIFHMSGEQKCIIPQPQRSGLKVPGTLSQALVFLEFIPCRDEDWDSLLYLATYQGYLRCFFINENGSTKEKCSFSFASYHPYGVASAVFNHKNQLLIVAGNYGKEPYISDNEKCFGSHSSISVWRLLSDSPYFAHVEDQGNGVKKLTAKELLKKLVYFRKQEDGYLKHGIYKCCLSPDATMLVTLHLDGRISLWHVPSFRLARTWHKSEQPGSGNDSESLGFSPSRIDDLSFFSNVIDASWWSEKELILARGSGAVTISSHEDLVNLLGDSPEFFDCWPTLSQAVNGHVLVLECEKTISTPGERSKSKQWLSEKDEEDLYSIRSRLKEITKQTLYFLTDAERFLPAVKPPKILTNTYRLVCLKSTTPEELYARKIDLEHYGDALDLARKFGLNTDLVYQRQWRKKNATKITIHDYLTKIKDRYWVLDECLLRIPNDFESTEHLLKYGLLGTSWHVFQAIDSTEVEQDLNFFVEPESDVDAGEEGDEKKFTGVLSQKQLRLCKYRWQLLQYLDRLSTYEVILGGSFKARDKFCAQYFSQFRSCNVVHQALEYARDEDSFALEHLFSYHGKYVLPHWLPILSNFPETADVNEYDPVVPEIGETADDPEILPWLEKHHRDLDWVEQSSILHQIQDKEADADIGEFIYDSQPHLRVFKDCKSKKVLHEWFVNRIYEIEERSKQIDKCCDLIELGLKRGITGFKELKTNLETLRILTYDVNIDSSLGLKELLTMSHLSKLKLLMSKSTEESFVGDFQKFIVPYLDRIGLKSMANKNKLLTQFLVDIAKNDLTFCLLLFKKCSPLASEPIIPDVCLLMKLAMECIYVCQRDDQLNLAFSIVECLPAREGGILSAQVEEIHCQLDQLEYLLGAAEVLDYHSYHVTVGYLRENKNNSDMAKEIIRVLIKNTSVRNPAAKPSCWNTLLKHLVKLIKETFICIDMKFCHQMFAKGLLQSGSKQNIKIAEELLTTRRAGSSAKPKEQHLQAALYVLKYDVSVNIVVEAAKEYFNAAVLLNDESMELARLCLSLISDRPPAVHDELDLIKSLLLLQEFNVSMLPLQVRLCPDMFDIIDMCLKEKNSNYKKYDKLLQMGDLLKICGNEESERNGQIRVKVGEQAFEQQDYTFASNICHQLIEDRFEKGWEICSKLGGCDQYMDFKSRETLLSFAMTFCPTTKLEDMLRLNNLLQTQVIYDKLRKHINKNPVGDDNLDLEDGQSLVKNTKIKTMQLFSAVKDSTWLGQAMKWTSFDMGSDDSEQECGAVESLQCHLFYESVHTGKKADSSKLDLRRFRKLLEGRGNEQKMFNELMLRSQKLAERRSGGELVEDTDEAFSNLAEIEFNNESLLSIAHLFSLSSEKAVQDVFDKVKKSKFTLLFAAYFYALQLYTLKNNNALPSRAPVYSVSPKALIQHMVKEVARDEELAKCDAAKLLLTNLKTLTDMQQAEMLQGLGKGVDVERFTIDDEYKKETILGLAMNLEENLMNICLQLAEKYEVPSWKVMLSHVEFLFTDSGLKAKAIRDDLNKWEIEDKLKAHGDEVFERMTRFVYPEINGKEHNKLLLFYVFLLNCTSPKKVLEGTLDLDSHVKLLKKIKAAAQTMDYKALIHGDSPLDVIQGVVRENNVHLLAKISSKIPKKDGTFLSPKKVFLVYLKKAFWNPERGTEKLDWMHHFENYQKLLPKLDLTDLVIFADHVTFSEEAFNLLSVDIRIEIINRLLKHVKKRSTQPEGKGEGKKREVEDPSAALHHLESSMRHLKSLQGQTFLDLINSALSSHQLFAKRYDLSGGDVSKIRKICSDMFKNLDSPDQIQQVLSLNDHSPDVKDVFQDALKEILDDIQCTNDFMNLQELINVIKESTEDGVRLITAEDFLGVIRPFCSSLNVESELKSNVLRLLEDSFELSGEDIFLLMWLQTDAIVTSRWNIKIDHEDIDSNEKRYILYGKLISSSTTSIHTAGLEELLSSWPIMDANESSDDSSDGNPWVQLLLKRIDIEEYGLILETLRLAEKKKRLNAKCYMVVYSKLKEIGELLVASKVMLSSGYVECYDQVLADICEREVMTIDDELLSRLLDCELFCRLTVAPIYELIISHLLSSDNSAMTHKAINQLHREGYQVEAGTLYMKAMGIHPSFFTFNNALEIMRNKFS